jgi:hypothetical protein
MNISRHNSTKKALQAAAVKSNRLCGPCAKRRFDIRFGEVFSREKQPGVVGFGTAPSRSRKIKTFSVAKR